MTLEALMTQATTDKVAVVFVFAGLPFVAFVMNRISQTRGNHPPFSYVYSTLIYASCIPGVLALTLWGHAMLFEQKGLWQLDFFVYYMPVISMLALLFFINKAVHIHLLPWFGELYELLTMIAIAFGGVVVLIEVQFFPLTSWWHIVLLFAAFYGLLKVLWQRFVRISRLAP